MTFHQNHRQPLNGNNLLRQPFSFSVLFFRGRGAAVFFLLFLFVFPLSSQPQVQHRSPVETRYIPGRGYITSGFMILETDISYLLDVLTNAEDFPLWLIKGMGEDAVMENSLNVSLNGVTSFPGRPNFSEVSFSLFLTKRVRLLTREISTDIIRWSPETGIFNHIEYRLPLQGFLVKEGGYHLYAIPVGRGRQLVFYEFRIRLAGIARALFNEKKYTRNINWYIEKIMENCLNYLP